MSALSPLDDRYADATDDVRAYFSEDALIENRVAFELDYLTMLVRELKLGTEDDISKMRALTLVGNNAIQQIRALSKIKRHDVAAVKQWIADRLSTNLPQFARMVHFGLTGDDVESVTYGLALMKSRGPLVHRVHHILYRLAELSRQEKSTAMLGMTHGRPAAPTTVGKEMANFYIRVWERCMKIEKHQFEAKVGGAVGNLNSLHYAFPLPGHRWRHILSVLMSEAGLVYNDYTTQILPYDNWLEYLGHVQLMNSALIDMCQDIWLYISRDVLTLTKVDAEVGSSAMPHKVNPIDFENAEGNLGMSNALIEHFRRKLPVSRLQRDLSDSTVRRNFGVALGYAMVAYDSILRGLSLVRIGETKEIDNHYEVLAEPLELRLRALGSRRAADLIKAVFRGTDGMSMEEYQHAAKMVMDGLIDVEIPMHVASEILAMSPKAYLGDAEDQAEGAIPKDSWRE